MAAVGHATAQGLAVSTSSPHTTYRDVCTISAGSFVAGEKYLIIASAFARHTSSANETLMRLVHGSTPTAFTDGILAYEETNGVQETNLGWMFVYTQPGTPEDIILQVASASTSTVTVELGTIIVINLDDLGTDGSEYHYNEVTSDYTTTSSFVAQASVTFTPNGSDRWLIIANGMINNVQTGANHQMQINDSVDGPLTTIDVEGEDNANELRGYLMAATFVPSNASHTLSARFSHETTAVSVQSSRIFALNTALFAQVVVDTDAAATQPAASPSWTNHLQVTPTPAVTGDWLVWGYFVNDVNDITTNDLATRLQIDPSGGGLASDPAYTDSAPGIDGWDNTDLLPVNILRMRSLTSGGARTINLDVQLVAGTSLRVQEAMLIAFSMELASGAIEYEQNLSGSIGFAGTITRQTSRALGGNLTPSGAVTKRPARLLSGGITPSGAVTKRTSKGFSGSIGFAGALIKQAGKVLSGAIAPLGTLTKRTTRALSGSITPTGALTIARVFIQNLSGSIGFAGALTRRTSRQIAGSLTPTGAVTKRTSRALGGSITPTGALSITRVFLRALSGSLGMSGTLTKRTSHLLAGSLTPSGVVTKRTSHALAGAILLTGSLTRRSSKALSGILTPVGSLTRRTARSLTGSLGMSGTLAKRTGKRLAGAITLAGAVIALPDVQFILFPSAGNIRLSTAENQKNVSGRENQVKISQQTNRKRS